MKTCELCVFVVKVFETRSKEPQVPATPSLNAVFAYVDAHRAQFLARLIDYLRRPSISAHGVGIAEVADHIAGQLQQLGLDTRIMPTARWPMVLGQRLASPDYVFTNILGVPAFVVPYANADEANHAPNENMEVERFFRGIKTGAAMLAHLGAMRKAR